MREGRYDEHSRIVTRILEFLLKGGVDHNCFLLQRPEEMSYKIHQHFTFQCRDLSADPNYLQITNELLVNDNGVR